MHKLYELKDMLIDELGEFADGNGIRREDVEPIKYLASAVDHLCNICEREDDMSFDDGATSNRSYARRSYRSYARGRGGRRDSMGRYSRADGQEGIETIKRDVQRLADKVEQM